MAKDILGHITCPHCGNKKATVHKQAKGSHALYYRCYPENDDPCGTVQIILAGGQKWIKANMIPLNGLEQEQAAEHAAVEAKAKQLKVLAKAQKQQQPIKTKSIFSGFFEDSPA